MVPSYWTQAAEELSASDPLMAELVAQYPGVSLVSRGDPFCTLARSIVGQQISVKAADSVWSRFVSVVGAVTPGRVAELGREGLEGCGLSKRKIEWRQPAGRLTTTRRSSPSWLPCAVSADGRRKCS